MIMSNISDDYWYCLYINKSILIFLNIERIKCEQKHYSIWRYDEFVLTQNNCTANLPNEYFAMLEKQQKYKQLTERVNKINQFQQNFIQCMSTIKISLIHMIRDFFKPDHGSFFEKIQHALFSQFDTVKELCLNLFRKVQNKLSNYQNQIANLSKNYKEQIQQMTHYQKKVQTIKKTPLQTKDDKERLQRNVDKKRFFLKASAKTEKLLIQNYDNFQIESEKLLVQCPREILIHFVEGNFLANSKLSQILSGEAPFNQSTMIRNSVVSDISDLDYSEHLSESQEGDSIKQCQIQMIIDEQSSQSIKNESQIIELNYNQDTSDGPRHFQITSPSKFKEYSLKKIKRSPLKKSSIQINFKNKENCLQKIKKMIENQIQSPYSTKKSFLLLDKIFENINSPTTRQKRKQKIFSSFKNKYSENGTKIISEQNKNLQKVEIKAKDHFHEKSFILSKQEFKNTHSSKSRNQLELKEPQRHSKNEQQTLNEPLEDENSSESTSKNQESSCASLSSRIQKRNEVLKVEEQNSKKIKQDTKYLKMESLQIIKKQHFFNQQPKNKKQNIKNVDLTHSIPVKGNNAALFFNADLQNFQRQEKTQHNKLGQQEKNKIVQQLFSITAASNKKNSNLDKKQVYLSTERSKDPKNWFPTTFLNPKPINAPPEIKKNENVFSFTNMETLDRKRLKSTNQPSNDSKIDFSIFSKIV